MELSGLSFKNLQKWLEMHSNIDMIINSHYQLEERNFDELII